MNKWLTFKIIDVCEFKNGFAFKSTDYVEKSYDTLEVFRMGYISRGGGFKEDTSPVFVPRKYSKNIEEFYLKCDDVLIAMTDMKSDVAILGNTARIRESDRFVVNQRVGRLRVSNSKVLDPTFFYFFSNWQPFVDCLRARANSGVQVNLSTQAITQAEITIPPLAEQRSIASVLGALDDKIELNRRMNETLEAMARAIFKDWFVDFGPTRAKMEGRAPYLAPDIWSLFPDRLDDEGRPEGWTTGKIYEIGQIICGKTPSTSVRQYYGNDVPFVTIPDMHGKIFMLNTSKSLSLLGASSQRNKTLPPGAICVSCIATPGLVALTTTQSQTNQQINSVIPKNIEERFYWFWVLRDLGEDIRQGGSGGSVISNLSTGRFMEFAVLFAPARAREAYAATAGPLFARILHNETESQTLATTRDLLLPKLMSGEVRVKHAEEVVVEAT